MEGLNNVAQWRQNKLISPGILIDEGFMKNISEGQPSPSFPYVEILPSLITQNQSQERNKGRLYTSLQVAAGILMRHQWQGLPGCHDQSES